MEFKTKEISNSSKPDKVERESGWCLCLVFGAELPRYFIIESVIPVYDIDLELSAEREKRAMRQETLKGTVISATPYKPKRRLI